uniref:Uncharacterized protein n=1 Tax=Triticum urartu TaxID=4572 RepID=A0A8R7PB97_TRIUA
MAIELSSVRPSLLAPGTLARGHGDRARRRQRRIFSTTMMIFIICLFDTQGPSIMYPPTHANEFVWWLYLEWHLNTQA